jgi:hypothetical protein
MRIVTLFSLAILSVTALVACEESAEPDDPDVSIDRQVEASGDFSCCINGSDYECDSSDAVLECLRGDLSGCDFVGDC